MSLFRTSFPAAGDFAPLFRLLDDYDNHRSSSHSTMRSFAPKFDVRESETSFHLDGELPGISQEDINIEFTDLQTLVVKGRTEREYHIKPTEQSGDNQAVEATEKSSKHSEADHHYWASERTVGEFSRTFSFPIRVDQDNVKASLKNGILSVVVPKATASAAKKITIE
ncbi:30 kDa heat shock protein [Penicillium cataractarum]|uniref:30 kDa heat shock protein n=1 Tax=Penicillium cataractarum TaxID=2100454 RepID=A0A9W9UY79_9EURO|nr:30 kDa heat shock protein [Penicillium cataractarum]KAJ5359560.1 30 kDa heat shock protein [Penicillium cataractarum]